MAVTPWGVPKAANSAQQPQRSVQPGPWPGSDPNELETFSPGDWQGKPVPAQSWLVDGLLATGTVAMISGDGGLGKSLLLQQLQTAAALGLPWLGFPTQKIRSLGIYCEDPKAELQRRQTAINKHYGCEMMDLAEDVNISCRLDRESYLAAFERFTDAMRPTPFWFKLEAHAKELGVQLIILDTVRKTFGGNEISERQVSRFIAMLRRLAIAIEGVVLLSAHPSNDGILSGSGLTGTRAWNNDVRSRFYLTRPKQENADQNLRVLRTMKSNYAAAGGKNELRWQDGVFVRADLAGRAWEQQRFPDTWS